MKAGPHAFNTPQAPERYEADVNLEATGTWQVSVAVSSDLGDILVELLTVEVPKASGYTAGGFALVGVSVVMALGGGYVWWAIRREQRKRVPV